MRRQLPIWNVSPLTEYYLELLLRYRTQYETARVRAHHARLALLIQRETVGLRHHRIVDQQFPEPPRRAASRRLPGT